MAEILLVEDEENIRQVLSLSLNSFGHEVTACENPLQAKKALHEKQFDVIITDLRMDGVDAGIDVVRMAKTMQDHASTLLLTAYASTETAVEAMREGAFDYITKPISRTELGEVVERALQAREHMPAPQLRQSAKPHKHGHTNLTGHSTIIQRVKERLERAAKRDFTVLITGESGTGKEVAARLVHESSPRHQAPFVPVHCGAIPENLFESELFGYVKGAFTGAEHDKMGLIESADGGTLFLDEIGEMPLLVQVKLLRVLQDMKVRPVGSKDEIQVDIRVVAATNRDLNEDVKQGKFREDLFYRLNVIPVHMPPLRQRKEDIPDLIKSIMAKLGAQNVKIGDACMNKLCSLPLAGNVRELENTLQRMLALSDDDALDMFILDDFNTENGTNEISLSQIQSGELSLDTQLEDVEKALIQQAMQQTQGNATKAAKLLGISFRSIRYRLEKLGIKAKDI
jgi:two-component system response regulator PilR (NtrC family)